MTEEEEQGDEDGDKSDTPSVEDDEEDVEDEEDDDEEVSIDDDEEWTPSKAGKSPSELVTWLLKSWSVYIYVNIFFRISFA